jgi:thiosulfate/3-mercaptopyruvate sulfurtransferase
MNDLLIKPTDLLTQLRNDNAVVLDTRTPEEYAAGHVPSAVHLPGVYDYLLTDTRAAGLEEFHRVLADLFSAAGLTGNERVVFYENGTGMRCARGWWLLRYAGHDNVVVLHGGLNGWVSAGGVTTTQVIARPRTDFTVRPRSELMATADDIMAQQGQHDLLVLDVRRLEEYLGTIFRQECCPRSGRIPGCLWFEWERVLSETTFKPLDEMQAELTSAGITPDKHIVVYCHRGARSSNTFIALKMLGYPHVRNYIGSWHEWSNRPELPLENG